MNREIKVTKCGEQEACELNDRISIEFCPFELSNLQYMFRARALEAKDYFDQGNERKMHETFAEARKIWEKERGAKIE